MSKVWKIAPGRGASHWEMCRELGCIALGWRRLKDYSTYSDVAHIERSLGGGPGDGAGAAQSVWKFTHVVHPSDIVVANQGRSRVVGIGIVRSGYLPPGSPLNPSTDYRLPNARIVEWLVDQPIELDKCFFGIATVHLLRPERFNEIIMAYRNHYPTSGPSLDRLSRNYLTPESTQTPDEEFGEGSAKFQLHRVKERNRRAVRRKKQNVLAKFGALACEACDFDFSQVYGRLGYGFAECHHRIPLATLDEGHRTRLRDLAIVCANCHRMIHKSSPMLSVSDLQSLIKSQKKVVEIGRTATVPWRQIPNDRLALADVPAANAAWDTISGFALSYYSQALEGSLCRHHDHEYPPLDSDLDHLRSWLLSEQRSIRGGYMGDPDDDAQVLAPLRRVIEAIRRCLLDTK